MCGCKDRSFRMWRRLASYYPSEGAFYLPSGLRVPRGFVRDHPTRAFLLLLTHLFYRR